ncbi:MAG: ATP-binding protein [Gemmatimonadota bacterium]|jgi:signal transduction histidine kinase
MEYPVATGITFFALGVNFLGGVVLFLLNPESRSVRWFMPFLVTILLWLFGQGWALLTGTLGPITDVFIVGIHLMPGFFLMFALADGYNWGLPKILAPLAIGLLLLPRVYGVELDQFSDPVQLAWQIGGWGLGSVLMARCGLRHRLTTGASSLYQRLVSLFLLLIAPLVVVGGVLLGAEFFLYTMPLLTVMLHVLLFVGVVFWRFYDIEVRAARSGEIATQAAELERMAVVGELTASFAHEVRNPLTGVRSLAQRLAEEDIADDSRRRYAGVIVREVERVEQIVAQLLDVARRRKTRSASGAVTQLEPLFEDLRLLLGSRASRSAVSLNVDSAGLAVRAAREHVAQALLNLLLNAIDHSPPQGRVELAAEKGNGADTVTIYVRDEGPGIPPVDYERIFEPLYSSAEGTGLGLSVVRRLAVDLGWEVEIGEATSGGAEFRLVLPSLENPIAAIDSKPTP